MRIVSYNILDGGEGRADPLAEVIEAQRSDVVAVIEADNAEVVARIARRLKMDFVVAQGAKHSVALLSRGVIVDSINHSALRPRPRCLLEGTIRDPVGAEWSIGVVHCHPRAYEADEAERLLEIESLLEVFEPHRRAGRPHLLVGDFNANSPIQQIDPERAKPATREAFHANGGQIPRRAVQRLLDAGYIDSLQAFRGHAAGTMASFTTQYPAQRVDYIFTHGIESARLADAWIEQDRLAKYASDHYPVGAEVMENRMEHGAP